MAFTVTDRGSAEDTFVGSLAVGSVFTPSESDLIIVAASVNAGTAFTSVTGWGATWSQIGSVVGSTSGYLHVWAAIIGASPGSDQPTINFSSTKAASAICVQVAGADTSGVVTDCFVQSTTNSEYNIASPQTLPTLASYASATNLSMTFNACDANNAFTPQAGWTQAAQASDATNQFNVAAFYFDGEDTSHTAEGSFFSFRWINSMGVEIAEAGGATNSIDTIDDPILDGETGNLATYTGMASASINSVVLDSTGAAVASPSVSDDDAGTVTFANFDISGVTSDSGTNVPNFGTVTVSFSNGTETEVINTDIDPKTGWDVVVASSLDTSDPYAIYQLMLNQHGITLTDGDEFYYPTASSTTINADGSYSSDLSTVDFIIIDRTGANLAYPVTLYVIAGILADTFSISDSQAAILGKLVDLSDTLSIADTQLVNSSKNVSLADGISLLDSILSSALLRSTLIDNLSVDDTYLNSLDISGILSDSYSLSDVFGGVVASSISLNDSFSISDSFTSNITKDLSLSDNFSLVDIFSTGGVISAQLIDNLSLVDSIVNISQLSSSLSDSLQLNENLSSNSVLLSSISEQLDLTDSITSGNIILAAVDELISLSDAEIIFLYINSAVGDTLTLTESSSTLRNLLANSDDVLDLTDININSSGILASIIENYAVSDNTSSNKIGEIFYSSRIVKILK